MLHYIYIFILLIDRKGIHDGKRQKNGFPLDRTVNQKRLVDNHAKPDCRIFIHKLSTGKP